ncbi:MAG: HEPN domain-containing protein [Treponema sp.]|nr:HEPN domain-containing protein [Treponema sp.]
MCEPFIADISNIKIHCNSLNRFSVTPRYPRELTLTDQDAQNAIDYAKIVFEFIKTRFSKQAGSMKTEPPHFPC